jgi:glycosyltransferase involved in cell wall biosynthesis
MAERRPTSAKRIVALVPALNEEGAIGPVVRDLRELRTQDGKPWLDQVLVVDNGSRDRTAQVAIDHGARVVREPIRGYGQACLTGIKALANEPPAVLVFVDGDGSCDVSELPQILRPILNEEADMVIGSRVRWAEPGSLTLPQRLGNRLASRLLGILYGAKASDLGPFRAITWPALVALGMSDPDYGWTVEMQVLAAKRSLRVREVDVHNRPRQAGRSKVSGTARGVVLAGYKILWTLARHQR